MHGGLSPSVKSLQDLRDIKRPIDPPNPSMVIDLLWSDPDKNLSGWRPNTRGVSYVFGANVVADMCQRLQIDLVARAHQVVQDGYEFFAQARPPPTPPPNYLQRRLVTIFSAPHYCGEYENAAGVMSVDENLQCTFDVFKATKQPVSVSLAH